MMVIKLAKNLNMTLMEWIVKIQQYTLWANFLIIRAERSYVG